LKKLVYWLLISLPLHLFGQTSTTLVSNSSQHWASLEWFWGIDSGLSFAEKAAYKQDLQAFCAELKQQQSDYKSQKKYLRAVFNKVHRKYLKSYQLFSPLSKTLSTGDYDCVSGTTLYALVLEELGFAYQIKEAPFHAYLLVNLDNNEQLLLESTNPIHGIIEGQDYIADTEDKYRLQTSPKNDIPLTPFIRAINLRQLAGLQYYNEAVVYFNRQEFKIARKILQKAWVLYPEDRIQTLLQISESFAQTVVASK
jgi:tetratricopeptide (TPR) repeat protein